MTISFQVFYIQHNLISLAHKLAPRTPGLSIVGRQRLEVESRHVEVGIPGVRFLTIVPTNHARSSIFHLGPTTFAWSVGEGDSIVSGLV